MNRFTVSQVLNHSFDELDEEVAGAKAVPAESPKMVGSFGAQYLMMYMAGQRLQMSSKWPLEYKVCCD